MKWIMVFVVFFAGCLAVFGEIDQKEIKRLQRGVRIDSVQDVTFRNDDREKLVLLRFNTTQDERDKEGFRIRVTVELTDKSKDCFYAQLMRRQGTVNSEYLGQDLWEFYIPHAELERPKVSAYVVEYGIMDGDTFVPIASALDDVDSVEELTGRCQSRIETGVKLKHAYVYREGAAETEEESLLRTLKK
jgi:hypothetical protein